MQKNVCFYFFLRKILDISYAEPRKYPKFSEFPSGKNPTCSLDTHQIVTVGTWYMYFDQGRRTCLPIVKSYSFLRKKEKGRRQSENTDNENKIHKSSVYFTSVT